MGILGEGVMVLSQALPAPKSENPIMDNDGIRLTVVA